MRNWIEAGERLLVIFDGHCGLCNRSVRWFLRRDSRDRMRFVASESPLVAALLARYQMGADTFAPSTIVVVRGADRPSELILVRSDAVVAMLRELPDRWPAVGRVLESIPRAVRDLGYRLIARYRYRMFGRLESCPIPTAEERARFL